MCTTAVRTEGAPSPLQPGGSDAAKWICISPQPSGKRRASAGDPSLRTEEPP
jgi:hypothetical protein